MASAQKQEKARLWRGVAGGPRTAIPTTPTPDRTTRTVQTRAPGQVVPTGTVPKTAPKPPPAAVRTRTPGVTTPPADPAGFKAAVTARRKPTVPAPGVVPGTSLRVPAPTRAAPSLAPAVTGLVPAGGVRPNPKTTPSHTLTGGQTGTPYHKPTPTPVPAPSPGLAAGAVRSGAPAPAAAPAVGAPASTHLMGTGQSFAPVPAAVGAASGGVADSLSGAATVIGQGAGNVLGNIPATSGAPSVSGQPTLAVGAPAAPAGPVDPYAGLPPEVATLLRGIDQTTNAQNTSLGNYFNTQAGASQDFAKAISANLGGLAQMAGFQPSTPTAPGVGGAIGALPAAMAGIGQQLTAGQGFDISNMASIMPGFLRRAGTEAQATLSSAGAESRGKVLTDYVDQQGKLAQTQAEQQGMDTRAAAQIGSQEKIAAANQAVQSANNTLDFVSNLYNAAMRSGDANAANQLRAAVSSATINAQNARNAADNATRLQTTAMTTAASGDRAAATGARATAKDYAKLRSGWGPKVKTALMGERVSTGSTSTKQGNTTTRTPTYAYQNQTPPEDVMRQMIAEGVKPRDAYNMVVSAYPRAGIPQPDGSIGHLQNAEIDLYNALGQTPAARKLVLAITHKDPVVSASGDYSG